MHEAAIGVVDEVRIVGFLHHTLSHLVVEAQVEDGVHHTGHGGAGTGAHADEQRVLFVAELGVHEHLDVLHGSGHVVVEQLHDFLLSHFVILVAAVGRDGESRGNGHADEVHLGQVGTFTTKFLTHFSITFGFSVAKGINSFLTHSRILIFQSTK